MRSWHLLAKWYLRLLLIFILILVFGPRPSLLGRGGGLYFFSSSFFQPACRSYLSEAETRLPARRSADSLTDLRLFLSFFSSLSLLFRFRARERGDDNRTVIVIFTGWLLVLFAQVYYAYLPDEYLGIYLHYIRADWMGWIHQDSPCNPWWCWWWCKDWSDMYIGSRTELYYTIPQPSVACSGSPRCFPTARVKSPEK